MPAREGSRLPQAVSGLETISPELALVDPVLADAAREQLPDPWLPPSSAFPARPPARRRRASMRLVGVGALVLVLVAAADASLQSGERREPVVHVAAERLQSPPRTFTWATSSGAASYEFQLFRGAERVYRTRAAQPRLQLPALPALTPGRYRWYVWPVPRGADRPSGEAIVSATLTIGGGK